MGLYGLFKNELCLFSAKNKPLKPVTITINGQAIEQKDYVMYSGVLIDSKLSFKQHIIGITKKICRAIGLLYKLRHYVSKKSNLFTIQPNNTKKYLKTKQTCR